MYGEGMIDWLNEHKYRACTHAALNSLTCT